MRFRSWHSLDIPEIRLLLCLNLNKSIVAKFYHGRTGRVKPPALGCMANFTGAGGSGGGGWKLT